MLLGVLVLVLIPLGAMAAAVGLGVYYALEGGVILIDNVRETFDLITWAASALLVVATVGLAFGVLGLWRSRSRRLPAGIPAAGVTTCSGAVAVLIVGLVVVQNSKVDTLRSLEEQRQEQLAKPGKYTRVVR